MTRYDDGGRGDCHDPQADEAGGPPERGLRPGERWTPDPTESDDLTDFPRWTHFTGLGADQPFEMAPFPTAAEKHAYFERVRAMEAEREARRAS